MPNNDTASQVARLRSMARAAYSRSAKAAILAGVAAIEALQWRPIEELKSEAWQSPHLIVFATVHDDGTMDTSDAVRTHGCGYTHFLLLPKMTVPHA